MKKKGAARRMLPPVYRSGGASVNAVDDGDVARLDGGGSDGEAAAARAAARMERLGSSRQRGGGAARDGARRRDRGARLARRCGRGGEPVVAPRPLRRGRARPRHRRGDAAAHLAPRAPLARAPRDGAAGGRRAVGGRHRALARLGSRLSGPGRERPHAGRRARRDRAADAHAPGLRRLPPRRSGRAHARARARARLRADRARGGRRLRCRRGGADGRGRGGVRVLPARQRGRRARALPDHGAAGGRGDRGPAAARRRGPRPPQPAPQCLPRCRHAPPLPRRDARRSLPRAPRVQHRAAQRRAPCHHGAVRRARLRDHPALPEHAAARLPDPRPVRRPRLPPLAHRGTATALRGRRAAHPERRRSGTDRGARLMRGRHRIYLVPGFFGFTNLGELGYFQHVREFLRAHATADVHVVRTHPTASLPQRAARVVETVAATMGRDGPVHLIGHSSGGLDARLAVSPGASLPSSQNVERVARRVTTVITVATPHHGTPLASFFASLLGQRLLRLLSLWTVYVLRFGRLPISVVVKLGALFARLDDHVGLNSVLLDQLFGQLLADFSPTRRGAVETFFTEVSKDQALLPQLTPEGMDVFNATVRDRPGVRYASVVTRARPGATHPPSPPPRCAGCGTRTARSRARARTTASSPPARSPGAVSSTLPRPTTST